MENEKSDSRETWRNLLDSVLAARENLEQSMYNEWNYLGTPSWEKACEERIFTWKKLEEIYNWANRHYGAIA